MRNKLLIPFLTIFTGALLIGTSYSAWVSTETEIISNVVQAEVTTWEFDGGPLPSGAIIEVDEDGNVMINGEPADVIVDSQGHDTYNYGDVTIKIEQDENGNLVLTEFTTSNESFALLGSTIYLPTAIEIDGQTYPVTGIAEPLDIHVSNPLIGTALYNNNVYIPEGYTYICDGAFASMTKKTTFHIPSTLESIGHGAFMPDRNVTQTLEYAGSRAQWNSITKPNDYENGAGNITVNYNG